MKTDTTADYKTVLAILQDYFDAMYTGDVEALRRIFHEDAWLKGAGYRRSRDEWLEAVAKRAVPKEEGRPYAFEILSVDIVGDHAMAKLNTPLASHFVDYLGLLKEEGSWKIVTKTFTILDIAAKG